MVSERLTYVTPLGVAFVDSATGRRVSEGLAVRVDGIPARANRVGVFIVPHIPGLAAAERGAGDDAYWASLPAETRVRVEVDDPLGRFLPFGFDADVPARGLFTLTCDSPVGAEQIELFSAPARAIPAGVAAVRAEVWDDDADRPAAWALLEASAPGLAPARGLADALGRVTILFPYPEPSGLEDGSPPSPQRRALAAQTWPIELRAFAAPQPATPLSRPDFCTVLTQPPALLHSGSPPGAPVIEATLEYGRELVVRTPPASTLVLTPAAP